MGRLDRCPVSFDPRQRSTLLDLRVWGRCLLTAAPALFSFGRFKQSPPLPIGLAPRGCLHLAPIATQTVTALAHRALKVALLARARVAKCRHANWGAACLETCLPHALQHVERFNNRLPGRI